MSGAAAPGNTAISHPAILDLDALFRPILELRAVLGTGVMSTMDPGTALQRSGGLIEAAVTTGADALTAVGGHWSGAAAEQAHRNGSQAQRAGHEIGRRSKDLGAVVQAAAGIVARGNAELAGIVESFAGTAAAAAPIALTPPGQAMLLAAAAEHLGHAIAVVSRTRAELAGQTAQLDLLATPIPLPPAPQVPQALGVAAQLVGSVAAPLHTGTAALLDAGRPAPIDGSGGPRQPPAAPSTTLPTGEPAPPTAPAATTATEGLGARSALPDVGSAATGGAGTIGSSGTGSALTGAPLPPGVAPAPASTVAGASSSTAAARGGLATAMAPTAPSPARAGDERHTASSVFRNPVDHSELVGDLGPVVTPVIGAGPPAR
ncbi:hypothetical protein [Skermania piniformis]|uniref:Uncharacterized protein n=1 Tax=Skermania pinensis TaxID=39122 RepID=A0ABX8SCB4_9ACTN|nr:hypothetical protein [Skermania piniformis]QXQ15433.1 hypothetical protein KV203_09080 [Skermania piniformis]